MLYFFSNSNYCLFYSTYLVIYADEATRSLLSTITNTCSIPLLVLYDPILLNDRFGHVMYQHLKRAGVIPTATVVHTREDDEMSSIACSTTLQHQLDKLYQCGFTTVVGCNMVDAYDSIVTAHQRQHANKCEMLDELEEWNFLMSHYCFVIAGGSRSKLNASSCHGDVHRLVIQFCAVSGDTLDAAATSSFRPPLGFMKGKCMIKRIEDE